MSLKRSFRSTCSASVFPLAATILEALTSSKIRIHLDGAGYLTGYVHPEIPNALLTAPHGLTTVMAQVAVAVSYGDRTAIVAGGGIGLEVGELFVASRF